MCQQEQEKVKNALWKLRREEKMLEGQAGNEACLKEVSDAQKKLKLQRRKLEEKERKTLRPARDAFYKEYGITLPGQETNNADPSSSINCNVHSNNNDGGSSNYDGNNGENQTQMCDGGEQYNNGEWYPHGQPGTKKVHVPKAKASSDAGTEAEEKPEENVVSATNTERKEPSVDNADAVPASESDKPAR
jgi:hypothetical protein